MLFEQDTKLQLEEAPDPAAAPPDAIISPDTLRENRIPPGQSRTRKWPVLDASGTPEIDHARWRLRVGGLVQHPLDLTLEEFRALPSIRVFADFHCVTRWSRLGNVWAGVSTRTVVELAGGLAPGATHVVAHGYDRGWTTNLPVDEFLAPDALFALTHDGEALSADHGGPVRLIVPRLYAWKSAKWLAGLEFLDHDRAGFWDGNGYHMHGDPWGEERFSY